MDLFTFISKIVDSIASLPVVLLIFIFLFRKKLKSLVSFIIENKWGKLPAQFGKTVTEDEFVKVYTGEKKEEKKDLLFFKELVKISPKAAILLAWHEFEKVSNPVTKGRFSYNQIFEDFKDQHHLITGKEAKSLTESRNLRNDIIHHGADIPKEKVVESAFSIYEISCKISSKIG
jgi:uncharacterized protein YutE (UPF0331/DUF86 family)